MEANPQLRIFSRQLDRLITSRPGDHQTGRCQDSTLMRLNDGGIDRSRFAEIIRVDDQPPDGLHRFKLARDTRLCTNEKIPKEEAEAAKALTAHKTPISRSMIRISAWNLPTGTGLPSL